jgi:6-pyruvoyltetrahydropterin/6-carboxytetrahydropterin synthase
MFKITKEFSFEMSHMLANHAGKCKNLHGHSYKLQVTVAAEKLNAEGMITDFADLKALVKREIISKADHAFGYNINTADAAEKEIAEVLKKNNRLVYAFESPVTAENMARHFFDILKKFCRVASVKLFETENSMAEYED